MTQKLSFHYFKLRSHVGDIFIYKAFRFLPCNDPSTEVPQKSPSIDYTSRLAIRFSRIHHEYISREAIHSDVHDKPIFKRDIQSDVMSDGTKEDNEKGSVIREERQAQLVPYKNIAGYAGVFVTGARPGWLICSGKSLLRFHPMGADGAVQCFTQFHNINCQHGFLYSNREVFWS